MWRSQTIVNPVQENAIPVTVMPYHCKWKLTFLEQDDSFKNINVI